MAELGVVERTGGGGVCVDPASVERREVAFGPATEVRHYDVAVHMRIQRTADTVDESGRGHGVGGHGDHPPVTAAPDGECPALHVVQRGVHGVLVGGEHGARHLGRAQGVEHAHRLRRAEAQVEGGDRDPVMGKSQPAPRGRVVASEHRAQRLAVDLSVQVERGRAPPEPPARRLDAGAGPVPGHLEVVGVPAPAHLGHPQHPTSRARPRPVRDRLPASTVTRRP